MLIKWERRGLGKRSGGVFGHGEGFCGDWGMAIIIDFAWGRRSRTTASI